MTFPFPGREGGANYLASFLLEPRIGNGGIAVPSRAALSRSVKYTALHDLTSLARLSMLSAPFCPVFPGCLAATRSICRGM